MQPLSVRRKIISSSNADAVVYFATKSFSCIPIAREIRDASRLVISVSATLQQFAQARQSICSSISSATRRNRKSEKLCRFKCLRNCSFSASFFVPSRSIWTRSVIGFAMCTFRVAGRPARIYRMPETASNARPCNSQWDRSFFGHPRGLSTLFFTEMWERFSYYGMRALLILFMTATVQHGGLGFNTSKAGSIYGLYTAMVFLLSLPGGWIADRIAGQRRAVLWGGIIIALGHFSMAIPRVDTFYLGLILIVIGTGMLKPNISTMVGALYSTDDARRDGGFSIFYMGINLGALLSPLVCGYLGENINWHYGFAAAGVGMTLGLIQYVLGAKYLGAAGLDVAGTESDKRRFRIGLIVAAVLIGAAIVLTVTGTIALTAEQISDIFGILLIAIVVIFFIWLFLAKGYSKLERGRFLAILVLFIASALFWSAYEQAGSTLNLFAERNTNLHAWDARIWGLFRASYFQALNSVFIIALAP